jgi:methionyl-tRNA synthetase
VEMVCLLCGSTPVIRKTEHFFLNLSSFNDDLLEWIGDKAHWRPNVRNFSIGYLEAGLRDRAITRDIEWGVPVPLDGYEGKRLYVWFEAVIGYLSASVEWAKSIGDESRWRDFWSGESRSYYFMGKDNIPFHTIIWPAMLMGSGDLNLPYDVPANEYLNLEGRQFSTSRNWAVWLPEYLDKYDPDPLRYVLASNMPETSDSDFSWREYVRANNEELVSTYGNLVHRVLTISYKNFDTKVPKPGNLDELSDELISDAHTRLVQVAESITLCRFREALNTVMGLAQECNRYLDRKEPWKDMKENRGEAATTLWVGMTLINCLKTMFYPFLPFSSEKLHLMLGFHGSPMDDGWRWDPETLVPGQQLGIPEPLFHKLDEDLVQHEAQRMGRS